MSESQPDFRVFAHINAPNGELYRAIMGCFAQAKSAFTLHLRPEEVLAYVKEQGFHFRLSEQKEAQPQALDREGISGMLEKLCDWGNLRHDQDTVEVTTVAEFLRKRYLYQMTLEGEAAETALAVFSQQLASPGELQTTALQDIQVQLKALEKLASDKDPDQARTTSLLNDLCRRFEELTSQAQRFMAGLQRHIDLIDVDMDTFMAYKEMLIAYLERFIKELVIAAGNIGQLLESIEAKGVARLLALAVERELQDVFNPADDEQKERHTRWWARWQGLRHWFIGQEGHPSQAQTLRRRALQAIPDLLSVVAAINERRANRSDRNTDLRTLATWFMGCDSDEEAHRLWRAAFGLHPARHLMVNEDTIAAWEAGHAGAHTSWLKAPRLHISPLLRQYGNTRKRGRPTPILDRSAEKQKLAMLAQAQAQQLREARRRLAENKPLLLSQLHQLDVDEFELFFDLLAGALGNKKHPQDHARALSSDGTLEMTLAPVTPARTAWIHTKIGTLAVREATIRIRDMFPEQQEEQKEAQPLPMVEVS